MTTLLVLSARDHLNDEVERYGPFDEVILRPGSNWIEVRETNGSWQTISLAPHHRVLIEQVDLDIVVEPRPDYSGDW